MDNLFDLLKNNIDLENHLIKDIKYKRNHDLMIKSIKNINNELNKSLVLNINNEFDFTYNPENRITFILFMYKNITL